MSSFTRLCFFFIVAVLGIGCTRNIVLLPTQENGAPSPVPQEDERSATVVEVEGLVEARESVNDPWQPATEGLTLNEGGQVRTGAEGRALVSLTEGSKIRLGPDTAFTFNVLNPFLDSLLTSLALDQGQVWVLLNGGALDVETPAGIASARSAYLSVDYDADDGSVSVTCLQGTCSFGASTGGIFISPGEKLDHAESNTTTEPMSLADYGEWGVNVAEATQLAFYATEALSQGSATLPVVPTETPSPAPPTETPAPTATLAPNQPSPTERPPSETPTRVIPTATPVPFTPIPPAPIIGRHAVKAGETLFCIARVYGVLPAAIAQASGIPSPFTVFPGQVLRVPAVQWVNILPGPVCAPQFQSPFPGLPFATETPGASATAANPPLSLSLNLQCVVNCGSNQGDYTIRIEALVSGGAQPYTFDPGQTFERTFPHCVDGAGTVTVTSADGQTASAPWSFHDVSCVPTAEPTPAPTLTPSPVTP